MTDSPKSGPLDAYGAASIEYDTIRSVSNMQRDVTLAE